MQASSPPGANIARRVVMLEADTFTAAQALLPHFSTEFLRHFAGPQRSERSNQFHFPLGCCCYCD